MSEAIKQKMSTLRLVALDVDGVMTDGKITYTSSGEELKSFNVKDGLGISLLVRAGIQMAIITARESDIVKRRAAELGIQHVLQGQKNKRVGIEKVSIMSGVPIKSMAYMGDDIPDIDVMKIVGLATCPNDAVDAVKRSCHWISSKKGGEGAIRELAEAILVSRDLTQS